ncbi:hypothetical protein CO611_08915 [Lysobacteraceae bacterium NML03-0222]|nr:hypothetical protein CO611_08915 [Xanthomonadaceae bacterium NML03-0222]
MTRRLPHSPSARTDNEAVREQSWQAYLAKGGNFPAAPAPDCAQMLAILASRPNLPGAWQHEPPPPALTRWQRWRGLLDVGWDARNRTPTAQRLVGMAISLLVNLFFVLFMLASLYLRLGTRAEPEEESMRIRITGFGTPSEAGGGQQAADGDLAMPASTDTQRSATQVATRQNQATVQEIVHDVPAAAIARMNLPQISQPQLAAQPLPEPQPLQVTAAPQPAPDNFQLPPPRPLLTMPTASPQLRSPSLPQERALPAPLPEVRAINITNAAVAPVPRVAAMPAESAIPEPMPMPPIDMPVLDMGSAAPQIAVREPGQRPLPALPTGQAESSQAPDSQTRNSLTAAASAATAPRPAGLPAAQGKSPQPGQSVAQAGVGPQRAAVNGAWPEPRRGDDWGIAAQNRAGQTRGGEQGAGGRQGGGLFDADGRPRLADDSFKPRFPDPNREGTWLRRPGMDTRGTMFDGIWRPPETLLQEWVRRGVKSIRIPIPGTTLELECVISSLQAIGGCLPVPGKDGVFDQPARARKPPEVPFKPELFEDQDALQPKS